MLKRLPISILFHATLAVIYSPTIILSFFFSPLAGGVSLIALIGLGILAALDAVIIRRKVNQRAFQAIEIVVIALLPLCVWPVILSGACLLPAMQASCTANYDSTFPGQTWQYFNVPLLYESEEVLPYEMIPLAFAYTAAFAIPALSSIFVAYIFIAFVIDKIHGNTFWLKFYEEFPPASSGIPAKPFFLGTRRTPAERAAVVDHCSSYIFQHSVFRKHAFEPMAWGIFRGIVAVYTCVGLVIFSAYSGISEVQLYASSDTAFTLQETILPHTLHSPPSAILPLFDPSGSALNIVSMGPNPLPADLNVSSASSSNLKFPNVTWNPLVSGANPQLWFPQPKTGSNDSGVVSQQLPNFNISWTGQGSPAVWLFGGGNYVNSRFPHLTQSNFTEPLLLFPFKESSITLTAIYYTYGQWGWLVYQPKIVNIAESGSNATTAMFSFDFQTLIRQRALTIGSPPAIMSVVHILSNLGGLFAFVEAIFALIFGRTIMAIVFGTRAISPFGLLGIVTRNRFKKLIHEQYPRIHEDIERGGMAAYVSEVAIDAGLMDVPPVNGQTGSSLSSHIGHEPEGEDAISMSHLRGRSSANHLQLPYDFEEFQGELDNRSLLSKRSYVE
ncbi:hypothetical protein FIBSPDRAFT_929535 [Athelia psychrophila]|uniref:Uncharacterized protein n=1 Tax=Athelia psychrophila TaxID=1759441 RepID=A0A166NG39_9AGAM|nr:hypothetical protein FIBSPDRAFT_929535 [Fibularhizoctonia sp. CBS 109695]